MNRARPWLELVRLPNCFTAIADIVAGYWLVTQKMAFTPVLGFLAVGSACIYAFGIVLNDLADVEIDRIERPNRPLPSGRISIPAARRLAAILLLFGLACIAIASTIMRVGDDVALSITPYLRFAIVTIGLILAICAYDLIFKETSIGPLFMGACRALNLALGMSVGWWFGQNIGMLAVGAMFLYVGSLTYFGREEAEVSSRFRLATGGAGVIVGIALLGLLIAPKSMSSERFSGDYFLLVAWLAFMIHCGRKVHAAVKQPTVQNVKRAMKVFILGLIVFDALIASAAHGWEAGAFVLGLLIPATILGRWVYST